MKIAVVAQRSTHRTFNFSLCRIFRKLRILLLCGIFMCLCRMLTQSSSRRIVFSFQRKIFIFCCKTIQFLLLFFADVETCTHTMIYQMFKCYVYSNPSLLCKRLHIKSILMLNIHLGGRDNICLFPLRKLVQTNY